MTDIWTVRSIQDDILIEPRKGYVIAEYEPLGLKVEGGTEAEARSELMTQIWASVARIYENEVRTGRGRTGHDLPTIKETMDEYINSYWQTHERKPRVVDKTYGVVYLEVRGMHEDLPQEEVID